MVPLGANKVNPMFSDKFIERVNRLIDVQLAERRKQMPFEISKIQREHNARGMLHSSMTILRIKEVCEREIEIRAIIIWQCLVRIINTLPNEQNDDLATDLKQFLSESINTNFIELTGILNGNLMNMMKPEQVDMMEAKDHAIAKHDIEVDLYVDSLEAVAGNQEDTTESKHDYHFYGNVASVQTGAGATANVVQNLGSDDKEAIKQALALARDAINAAEEMAESKRNELVEIVSDANNELDKATPNSTKLQSLFIAIGTTIQTLASAKPAYQTLKTALLPLGITLP
jgi:hypothetical protein